MHTFELELINLLIGFIDVIVHTEPLHRPKASKDNCPSSSEVYCVTQTDADIVNIDERHELTTSRSCCVALYLT